MFRAIRVPKSTSVAALTKAKRVRTYATEAPRAAKSSNNVLLFGALAAAGGAAYWYYTNPNEAEQLKAKAKKDEEEAIQKAREAGSAGKARVEDAYRMGQLKFDEVKASADKTISDAEARAKQAASDAQAKFDGYKQSASKSVAGARDSTENLYNEARGAAGEKKEEAKAGWFSWLGWGKSNAEDVKKSGAQKVANAAGDVQDKANKHA
ncbi:hypothetical protein BT96DRAFT_665469 [Gymnopus androsaceus JB14]|uniref:Late embryogenesis abundant protein n=1 Tax=Gymnopus androsaceus JB14 TaxID=1447944 RepID=A0A6A4IHT4_9AGAR|nr:hypothetical protein BT96DRAFT_665469 [Gymnopus androsaceus JB14]